MKALVLTKINPIDIKRVDVKRSISEERIARSELFTGSNRKNKFITAELISSQLISELLGISLPMLGGKTGQKPYLHNYPQVSISRSYADNSLAFALECNSQIGVDCERVKNYDKRTLKFFFTDKECNYIANSVNPNLAYALIWTRKESYIKCIGEGLTYDLQSLDVTPAKNGANSNSIYPVFNNEAVKKGFINSYIYNDLVISLCSTANKISPPLQVKNVELGVH